MNPYKEKTSEWHAFEQGKLEGLEGAMTKIALMGVPVADDNQAQKLHDVMKMQASSMYGRRAMTSDPATARGKVLNHLRMHGPTRRKELYKLGNIKSIDKAITVLQTARQIQRVKYGTYAIRQKDSK